MNADYCSTVIEKVLLYLPQRKLLVVTSSVCKSLQDFRWLKSLWDTVDTRDLPSCQWFKILSNIHDAGKDTNNVATLYRGFSKETRWVKHATIDYRMVRNPLRTV